MTDTLVDLSSFFETPINDSEQVDQFAERAFETFENYERFDRLVREQRDSGNADPLKLGIALALLGQHAAATEQLDQAPASRVRDEQLAHALVALGRYDDALAAVDRAAQAGWPDFDADMFRAEIHIRRGELEPAEQLTEKHMRVGEDRAEWYYIRGRLHEARGERDKASEIYERALTLAPEHEQALFHAAWLYDMAGDDEQAIDLYEQVALRPRARINALLNLAVVYEDLGMLDRALRCLRRVLRVNPNHPRARLFMKDVESSRQMIIDESADDQADARSRLLDAPISEFELSVRARNCLKKMNIHTLGQLVQLTEAELLAYKNFGEASLNEIKQLLARKGLRLGQRPDEIDPSTLAAEEPAAAAPARVSVPPGREAILSRPVGDLELSVRSRRCLQRLNVGSLGDLIQHTESDLLSTRNFGVTSLNEIKARLADLGLSLAPKRAE